MVRNHLSDKSQVLGWPKSSFGFFDTKFRKIGMNFLANPVQGLRHLLCFVVVQSLSCIQLFVTHGLQYTRLPCPSPSHSTLCPLSQWCQPTISSSSIPFSCFQSFPAQGSSPISQLFTSDGQSTGASASASVLPMDVQDWFPLGLPGLISLLSKGFSRVFSNTAAQKHQFFGAQLSLWSNSQV